MDAEQLERLRQLVKEADKQTTIAQQLTKALQDLSENVTAIRIKRGGKDTWSFEYTFRDDGGGEGFSKICWDRDGQVAKELAEAAILEIKQQLSDMRQNATDYLATLPAGVTE